MRHWNYNLNEIIEAELISFLPYLWGIETFNDTTDVDRSFEDFYPTYEALKLRKMKLMK